MHRSILFTTIEHVCIDLLAITVDEEIDGPDEDIIVSPNTGL